LGATRRWRCPSRMEMTSRGGAGPEKRPASRVVPDLVEYLVIVVPDVDSLASVASALADLVTGATIRILDLVVVARRADGSVLILEPETLASLAGLADAAAETGGLLSDHDIELVALGLEPATVGLVVVTEDRWAAGLSAAARQAGGLIVAGERIPAPRVEAALADRPPAHDPE
jgi:hypothetical protein